MANGLFRKVALERLSSPEQIDQLMQITSLRGWIALLAIGVLLACVIIWGIWGSIPIKVNGSGLLIKSSGIVKVTAPSSGIVKDVYFGVNDFVHEGQTVARIAQPGLLEKINNIKKNLLDLENKYNEIKKYGIEELKLENVAIAQQENNIKYAIKTKEDRLKWLKERLKNQEDLFKDNLIVKAELIKTKEMITQTKIDINKLKNQLKELKIKELNLKAQKDEKLKNLQIQINETKRHLAQLQTQLDESSKVITPWSGKVIEVAVKSGDQVAKGTTILRIERIGKEVKNLEAVIFFPPTEGKKIKRGMKIEISPSIVKQEEYGFILGIVTFVSQFPITSQSMTSIVENPTLVKTFLKRVGTAPIEVRADLIPDPNTPSGYKWSSSRGPNLKIQPGTLCSASVTVEEKRPISLVIPMLKKCVLGVGENYK